MGAMAPPPHWIPEDDVLLKNAVEAGASLESLAKGAVQFSRRYTVQELRDRWSSLLYDPVVSKEASANMVEVERFGVINQLRPNKLEGVKDITCSSGKRKAESVRKYYYAMRKRICNEPLDMIGLDLVSEPGYPSFRDVNEFSSADFRIDNSDNLGARGPDCIIRPHSFPEFGLHAAESTENDATPLLSGVQNHGQEDLCGENVPNSLPFPYEENISLTGDCSEIPGFVQSKDLPVCNLFEADDLVNEAGACSEFVDQSFHSFGCPPPLTEMPIWHTSQEISIEVLPIQTVDADQHLTDEFMLPEAGNEPDALGDMTSSTQEYLEVLFDLSNDEGLLYMDNDGKEAIEKSYLDGLSSLLLDSPNQCELSGSGLGEPVVAADRHVVDGQEVADAQVSGFGSTMKVGPEYRYGVICCILNTEDPEIPSNDDVFLPFRFPSPTNSSGPHWTMHSSSYLGSSSVKNFSSTCTANGGHLGMKNTQRGLCVPSGRMFHPSDASARYRREHGDKFELPESSVQHGALREARRSENPNHVSLANVNANNVITGAAKGGPMEMGQGKNIGITSRGPCPDKKENSLDTHQNLQKNTIGGRNGVDGLGKIPCNRLSNYDPSFKQTGVPKATDQSLLSDHEELLSENDFDVPYFSDVEAMILDMDLSPDEFDLYTNPEVQRYLLEETKRTIIRLEQAADAFTQRAVNGQGAFAILYGRCSRHFIRKTEVLLGRETDDIKVDIDLGREKNGGKISRRQATIKMDLNGMFHLKNLGKTSIYMNGKEVAPGHSLGLISGCLIEVRGLAFVFETNRKMIKQYVDGYTEDELLADHKLLTRS